MKHAAKGINLIEVTLSIALLGVLIVVMRPGAAASSNKVDKARGAVENLAQAVMLFHYDTGHYPDTAAQLLERGDSEGWQGPYATQDHLKDPWGRKMIYQLPGKDGRAFEVYSLGADGERGGKGKAADIYSWDVMGMKEPVKIPVSTPAEANSGSTT